MVEAQRSRLVTAQQALFVLDYDLEKVQNRYGVCFDRNLRQKFPTWFDLNVENLNQAKKTCMGTPSQRFLVLGRTASSQVLFTAHQILDRLDSNLEKIQKRHGVHFDRNLRQRFPTSFDLNVENLNQEKVHACIGTGTLRITNSGST